MTAQRIDEEVRDIIIGAYKKALQLIKNNEDTLHEMANALNSLVMCLHFF
jgi:ATP-dependent Zn protease